MRPMTQPAKGQEPTMEEILASIRRIIADDDQPRNAAKGGEPPPRMAREPQVKEEEIDSMLAQLQGTARPAPPPAPPPPASAPPEEPAADILELTEQMAVPEPPPGPAFRTIDGQSDLVFEESPPEPPPAPHPVQERRQAAESDHGLMSAATTAAVDSAFNTLAQTVLVQNGRTLEDLVREMLRPLLKTWLDDNLPGMVERLVRSEIERVSRGRS
jgi:uncharacterized protein